MHRAGLVRASAAALVGLVALGAAGCYGLTEPGTIRTVGIITPGGPSPDVLEAPVPLEAGRPQTVTVNTFGSSTCVRPDGVTLKVEGMVVEIVPYDLVPLSPAAMCTRDMAPRPHPVTVTFDRTGTALFRIIGVRAEDGGFSVSPRRDTVEVEVPVAVVGID